jgi:diguanylate cyclase (GGDEF)-like protein/PAS domain S-box-containing protein
VQGALSGVHLTLEGCRVDVFPAMKHRRTAWSIIYNIMAPTNNRFHERLLDAVGQAVIATDPQGKVVYWNKAAESLYGWSAKEAMRRPIVEITPSEELAERAKEIMTELGRGRSWTGEFTVRRKDGTTFPVMVTDTPVHDEQGNLVAIIGVSMDITEIKQTEELRRSEERFRLLAENAQDLIFRYQIKPNPGFEYVSPSATAMLGYTPEELYADPELGRKIVHPDDRHLIDEVLRHPESPVIIRWLRKDGNVIWAEQHNKPIYDETGELVVIESISRDITERVRAVEKLKESERRFSSVVSNARAYVYHCLNEPGYPNEFASDYALELTGYPPEDLLLSGKVRFGDLILEEDRGRVWEEIQEALAERRGFQLRYTIRRKDGTVRHVQEYGQGIYDEGGQVGALEGLVYDVTESVRVEERLREAEKRYLTLVERVPAVVYIQEIGSPDSALYMSPQIETLTGYSPEECKDPDLRWGMVHPDDREWLQSEDQRTGEPGEVFTTEYRVLHRDGRVVWVRNESVMVEDEANGSRYWQGFMLDITERKTLEEELRHRAFHDLLTGLPNRHLFLDRLGQTLRRTRSRPKRKVAVLFMDLDNFKVVNDSLGHELGDELLVAVVERLRGSLRPEDTVARFGGDEFTILIEDVASPEDLVRVAERIVEDLRAPFVIDERELFVRASIGIAMGDARTKTPEELLRDADTAMYRAKEDAADYRMFDPGMYERVLERLELENELRRAPEKEEFTIYYQPKFRLAQPGRIESIEALVRWEHPQRGLMLPEDFIPIAEETGLIISIGGWVMKEACRQAKEWQERYPSEAPSSVCVNLSASQVRHPGLLQDVRAALRDSGLEAGSLILEITEGTLLKDTEVLETIFGELKTLGVRLAIDDFGKEYSSLSYLKRLPVDGLKIDGSFVARLGRDPSSTTIVKAVISLAHSLGLEVTGEGVESAEQLEHLIRMGCDLAQGYHLARPLPSEEVEPLLADQPVY